MGRALRRKTTGAPSRRTLAARLPLLFAAILMIAGAAGPLEAQICPLGGLTLFPSTLPNGTAGVFYSQTLSVTNGTAPYSFSTIAGSLPPGLTLSGATISGTPSAVGTFNFTIRATDSSVPINCSGTQAYSVQIVCPTITVSPPTLPGGAVGTAYSQTLTASGGIGPYTFAVTTGSLPGGLTLSSGGALTGTPNAAGTFSFTVTATDSTTTCTGSRAYTVGICPLITLSPATLPAGAVGVAYSQTITSSGGAGASTFTVTSGSLPTGLTLSSAGALTGTPSAGGNFNFTITATDTSGCTGSHAYSIRVCSTISLAPASLSNGTVGAAYNQTITGSGGTGPYTFAVTGGSLPGGLTLSSGGALTGTPNAPGTFNFTVTATDANGCTGSKPYSIVVVCPTITLSPSTLPNGTIGVAYSQTITASGGSGSHTFAVTSGSLPGGLSLSSGGALTGTPNASGSFSFTVTATDSTGCTGNRAYTIGIGCPTITLSPSSLPGATFGSPYGTTITASGGSGPYTFAVTSGSLPGGLSLSSGGALTGTPNAPGNFSFTITATDRNGCTGSRPYSISVSCATITISPSTLPSATSGVPYSQTLTASGGTGPYSFAITAGSLPSSGLTLSSSGVISGTPAGPDTHTFTITATDANGCTGTRTYTLSVACPTVTVSPGTLPGGTAGVAYNQTITASGGTGSYTFAVTSGNLPGGLSLASGGALTGTPTTPGTFNFTVTATDGNGCTGSRGYTVAVACPTITVSPASLPGGIVGTGYGQTLNGSGGAGPYSFAVTSGSLPTGLNLTSVGALSGTPTAAGTFNFTVTATDANGCTGSGAYSVNFVCPTITLFPATLPGGAVGVAYNQTLGATGGNAPYTFAVSSGTLPTGLTLSNAGILSGSPTAGGSFTFTVRATDVNSCSNTASYTVEICPILSLSPTTLPAGAAGVAYNQALTASGGTGPYTFALTNGSLPAGVNLSPAGVISGTPAAPGGSTFTVTATDSRGCTVSRIYSLNVSCPTVTVSPSSLPPGTVGQPYSASLAAAGGIAPYTFRVTDGAPPGGISLSSAGVLSGTPTTFTPGTAFTVTAADVNGCAGLVRLSLSIGNAPPEILSFDPGGVASGGPAFTLTVRGRGFVETSVVNWNGSPRPTTFVSSTQLSASITAADIANPGNIPVTVVNPAGTTSNPALFPITAACPLPGAPGNVTVVPNDNPAGPVTGVDFLRLSWTSTGGATPITGFEFAINGDPYTPVGLATSVVVPPRGSNDPIQLHVRAVGCTPPAPGKAGDSPVYSPQPPKASFSARGPVAPGTPVTFTDTSDPQATSWLWLFGDGQIATTQSVTHAFSAPGNYSVVLIASNGAGSSLAIRTQPIQAGATTSAAIAAIRPFDSKNRERQWLGDVAINGSRRVWLRVSPADTEEETIVYLRFHDAAGQLLLERRLSVAPGQEALYDLGTYGLHGNYWLELVSARTVSVWVVEESAPDRPPKERSR